MVCGLQYWMSWRKIGELAVFQSVVVAFTDRFDTASVIQIFRKRERSFRLLMFQYQVRAVYHKMSDQTCSGAAVKPADYAIILCAKYGMQGRHVSATDCTARTAQCRLPHAGPAAENGDGDYRWSCGPKATVVRVRAC